jgi:prolyl-tRNA synthetase
VYTYLPLAQRVLARIKAIVQEEMDRAGGQEILLPIIQPAELWLESGRWNVYGPELFRLKDRHGRDFCLGPTHEEIITDLVKGDLRSYKQLPLLLYQIQNKYRDERRPRFGLMRGREFIMKDLYSFDRDEAGLDVSYRKMYDAYTRIFERCGLEFRPVEADSGPIGGSVSHEFMVLADSGEGTVVYCPDAGCRYAANIEKAVGKPIFSGTDEEPSPREEVITPGMKTVEQVTAFLGVGADRLVKTLLYETPDGVVAALVRGDREVNEIKLQNVTGVERLELADAEIIRRVTQAPVGFTGPVGLDVETMVVDEEVANMVNCITGANRADAHYRNVNPGRDFRPDIVADIRVVDEGQVCARCGASLKSRRGIEVGQVFKLGTKYSKSLNLTYLDEQGGEQLVVMGCYGIGVSRTMAAAVEQNYDTDGIIWPASIAPFKVVVVPVNTKDQVQTELAEKVYRDLWAAGIDTMLDDRTERPGVKFKDADLVGYPVRVTVGKKAADGEVEVLRRRTREMHVVPVANLAEAVREVLAEG